jgi:hypothetical protein
MTFTRSMGNSPSTQFRLASEQEHCSNFGFVFRLGRRKKTLKKEERPLILNILGMEVFVTIGVQNFGYVQLVRITSMPWRASATPTPLHQNHCHKTLAHFFRVQERPFRYLYHSGVDSSHVLCLEVSVRGPCTSSRQTPSSFIDFVLIVVS